MIPIMTDLMNFFRKLFKPKPPRHICDSDRYININGCFDPNCPKHKERKPLPKVTPKAPPPPPQYMR